MTTPLKPGANYSLVCLGGSFTDIYGHVTDSVNYRITVATEEDYGSVTANLTGYEGDVIIQLVAEKDKVVREIALKSPGKVRFGLLDKGRYRLKAIYDLDGNRHMDNRRLQPEKSRACDLLQRRTGCQN